MPGAAPDFGYGAIQYAISCWNSNSGRRYWNLSNNENLRGTNNQIGRQGEDRMEWNW